MTDTYMKIVTVIAACLVAIVVRQISPNAARNSGSDAMEALRRPATPANAVSGWGGIRCGGCAFSYDTTSISLTLAISPTPPNPPPQPRQ